VNDYVIRSVNVTPAGHNHFEVVDMKGRLAHVTVDRQAAIHGAADTLIRARLAHLDEQAARGPTPKPA
jgi:hypothetical protein